MTRPYANTATEKLLVIVYRLLLLFFPRAFRAVHQEDMEGWFLRRFRARRGVAKAHYLVAAALDTIRAGLTERAMNHTGTSSQVVMQEAGAAARGILRRPGWSFLVVFGLSLPVAANTAILGIVDGAVLAPMPYADADRLAMVWAALPASDVDRGRLSGPELAALAERSNLLASSGAIWSRFATLGIGDGPEHVDVGMITGAFFETLGREAEIGRTLLASDDIGGSEPLVLLTHRLWDRRFGSDPTVVGRTIAMNGESRRIVGVMPEDFTLLFPGEARLPDPVEVFVPWGGGYPEMDPEWHLFAAVARLAPGATPGSLNAELASISTQLVQEIPEYGSGSLALSAELLRSDFVAAVRPGLSLLLVGALTLLLVASANTASLLLVRARGRRGEFAVMAALGADGSRILARVTSEGVILFFLAGVVGLGLAIAGLSGFDAVRPPGLRFITEPTLSPFVLLATLGVLAVTGLVASALPALKMSRELAPGLSATSRGGNLGSSSGRGVLVSGQVALSLMLLIGSGLMFRSMMALGRVDRGFSDAGVATFRLSISGPAYPILTRAQSPASTRNYAGESWRFPEWSPRA